MAGMVIVEVIMGEQGITVIVVMEIPVIMEIMALLCMAVSMGINNNNYKINSNNNSNYSNNPPLSGF